MAGRQGSLRGGRLNNIEFSLPGRRDELPVSQRQGVSETVEEDFNADVGLGFGVRAQLGGRSDGVGREEVPWSESWRSHGCAGSSGGRNVVAGASGAEEATLSIVDFARGRAGRVGGTGRGRGGRRGVGGRVRGRSSSDISSAEVAGAQRISGASPAPVGATPSGQGPAPSARGPASSARGPAPSARGPASSTRGPAPSAQGPGGATPTPAADQVIYRKEPWNCTD